MSNLGSGMRDWMAQRFTAVIIFAWAVWLFFSICKVDNMTFDTWRGLFQTPVGLYLTFFAMLSILLHAWLGIWTVVTDYIKPTLLRKGFLYIVLFVLLLHAAWGTAILWGNV